MHPNSLISLIESDAPPSLAASWDRCGVQVAACGDVIRTVCVALDPTPETVARAVDMKADFLLCHHPLTLAPRLPDTVDDYHRVLSLALGHDMWIYSAHTSLDANPAGPVNWLGRFLGLEAMQILEVTSRQNQALICLLDADDRASVAQFETHLRPGAGQQPQYLLWPEEQVLFRSMLRPGAAVMEHPVSGFGREYGFGCIGVLPAPMAWSAFTALLRPRLGTSWRTIGAPPSTVTTVAYCPGSGADLGFAAFARGADVYLTGDVKYHQAQALQGLGATLDVGHFCLEETMMQIWSQELAAALADHGVAVAFLQGRDPFA